MFQFEMDKYSSSVAGLLRHERLCELGPGDPDPSLRPLLESAEIQAPPNQEIVDNDMADCCLAGLWLIFDYLDQSHAISQRISSPSGSYWHGLMHRREPDFSNAKYWFRKVGDHEVFVPLANEARLLAQQLDVDSRSAYLRDQRDWDPFRFVDLCESVLAESDPNELGPDDLVQRDGASGHGSSADPSPDRQLCRAVAQLECRLLFDFCYQNAIG